jgi:hypothetical protein
MKQRTLNIYYALMSSFDIINEHIDDITKTDIPDNTTVIKAIELIKMVNTAKSFVEFLRKNINEYADILSWSIENTSKELDEYDETLNKIHEVLSKIMRLAGEDMIDAR